MTCRECELWLADGAAPGDAVENHLMEEHLKVCAACRAMQADMRENALALAAFRDEALPARPQPGPRSKRSFPWISAAAAAAVLVAMGIQAWQWKTVPDRPLLLKADRPQEMTVEVKPSPPPPVARVRRPKAAEPLKIKMLTDDPDVVIYWLIDSERGE
jgi:hypothetical protein